MTRAARVAAQAKINVWLHVGGVDASGYHEIFTLFQRVDLADEVVVRAFDDHRKQLTWTASTSRPPALRAAVANLAYRAAEAYQAAAGWPAGFEVELVKRIPVGGGLGGGSADAGAVLRSLNALAPRPLAAARLLEIAGGLGSDVPFLASEHVRAVGRGRGERLIPFAGHLPTAPVLLLMPPFGVATSEAYRWIDEAGARALDAPVLGTPEKGECVWADLDLGNDFEPVVEARHPVLRAMRESLASAGAAVARLSGSGSTVMGIFPEGLPRARFAEDAVVVDTRTSDSVVQVEVLE